jgi:hypothetical protein
MEQKTMKTTASRNLSGYVRSFDYADVLRLTGLSREAAIPQARAALQSSGVNQLLAKEGIAVITGLEELDSGLWPGVFVNVCRALGPLLPQSVTNPQQLVREVIYREGGLDNRSVRYSDSRSGGGYHSDGVPVPGVLPGLLGLLCIRQALTGGELVFIESAKLIAIAVKRMPELISVLSAPFHFDQRREDDPRATVVRQIIETSTDGTRPLGLVYLREYVESGHAVDGVRPLSPDEIRAMNVLDAVMDDESLHIEGRLAPGQIVISDNRRYLHGRHAFRDAQGTTEGRLLLRCWIR